MAPSEEKLCETPVTVSAKRPRRNLVWLTLHVILYFPIRIWCGAHAVGRENLDENQGGIMLANHQSFLDPLLLGVRLTRPISFLARDSLFKVPFLGWICRTTYVIPISRTAFRGGSIRKAVAQLDKGFLIGMYPEGTRSSGPPKVFRPGFLSLVRRTDVPIYPVAIVGTDKMMPRGAWFIRPARATVVYGEALSDEEAAKLRSGKDDKLAAALVRDKVAALYDSVTES